MGAVGVVTIGVEALEERDLEVGLSWAGGCWGGRGAEAIGMEAVGVVTMGVEAPEVGAG